MDPFHRDRHDQFLRLYVENEDALRGFVRSVGPTVDQAQEGVISWNRRGFPPAW